MNVLLTIDLEEFSLPLDFGRTISKNEMLEVSIEGFNCLKEILEEYEIKVTFFVTIKFGSKSKKILKYLKKTGHEIALHATSMTKNDLTQEKKLLEKIARTPVIGIRMHKLLIPNFSLLHQLDFKYDSSIHPTIVPFRYNNLKYPTRPFYK